MKPVYHKIVICPRCDTRYDKGNRKANDWHKFKLCINKHKDTVK